MLKFDVKSTNDTVAKLEYTVESLYDKIDDKETRARRKRLGGVCMVYHGLADGGRREDT